MTETDYIALLKEGNHQGLKLCYQEYYKLLLVGLRSRQIPLHDAEEIIQDAFVKLWELRTTIQNKQHVKALLYQSLKWGMSDLGRRNVTRKKIINDKELTDESEKGDSITQLYLLEIWEYINHVFMAIDSLPPNLSRVLWLRIEGYTGEEISKKLEISHKTVRTAIYEARKRLGKIIPDRWLLE